jgi:hypothetical protein
LYTDRKETTINIRKKKYTKQYKNTEHKEQKSKHAKEGNKHKANNENIKRVIRT